MHLAEGEMMTMGSCGAGMMLATGLGALLVLGLLVGLNILVWMRVMQGRRHTAAPSEPR